MNFLSQSKAIAKKLLVTSDDVTRPPMLIAHVIGTPVDLNVLWNPLFVCFSGLGSICRQSRLIEIYPIDL